MKKTLLTIGYLLIAVSLSGGCWATMGDVRSELIRNKVGIEAKEDKQIDEKIAQTFKKIEEINAKIDADVMPKIVALQTELYNNKQDTHKLVEEHIAELKKEIDELRSQIKALEAGNKK